jgi:hypothetical protein
MPGLRSRHLLPLWSEMNQNPFVIYANSRHRLYEALDRVRAEIDEWVERYTNKEPKISELAILEALHAERARLLSELNEAGDRFMTELMRLKTERKETP